MEEVQKRRLKGINIVFLITMSIMVVISFLPLDFLSGRVILATVLPQVLIALPTVIYLLVNKLSFTETVRLKRMRVSDMLLVLLFGMLIRPAQTLISALSLVFSTNVISNSMLDIVQAVPFLGGVFLVAVVPAVVEESVFRGAFYNEYSKIHIRKAALLSGLLFGILHGNFNQFCYAFFMGVLFSLLIEATGSILSSMLVHFLINASSVVMLYLLPAVYQGIQAFYNMYKENGMETMVTELENMFGDLTLTAEEYMLQMLGNSDIQMTVPQVFAVYGFPALIGGVLAFYVYKKLAVRNGNWHRICASFQPQAKAWKTEEETQQETQSNPGMVTVPLVLGILLGVAYMILVEILLQRTM